MRNSPIIKKELESLYLSGNSMFEIAYRLKCSVNKVVYWMNKYKINKRSRSEALYIKLNPKGNPFKIKPFISTEDKFLFGLGLAIYWGEGEKISKGKVRVANTNPSLILVFREFLIKICQVDTSRIHYYIISFKDSDINEVRQYWSKLLAVSGEKFGKIVQISPRGKGSYRRKSLNGVCIIEFSNIKLKEWLMQELQKLGKLPT